MFSKEQASALRMEFWNLFGQSLKGKMSAEGMRINWINYKTGVKDVYFRMNAESKRATIGIQITHQDLGLQELFYQQFLEAKSPLENTLGEKWIWEEAISTPEGKIISQIYTVLEDRSIFNQKHWPEIMKFLKPRIIKLDEFWSVAGDVFKELDS